MQLPDDVALGAVIQKGNAEALLPFRRMDGGLPAGNGLHHAGNGVGLNGGQVGGDFIADRCVHHAVFPDDAGQLTGIHAVQSRHALLLQEGIQIAVRPEIGGRVAPLPHHITPDAAGTFKIFPDDAVVADEGVGLHDDLPGIAGVRQGLNIAAHTRGEHQLTHGIRLRAEAHALKHPAIL